MRSGFVTGELLASESSRHARTCKYGLHNNTL